MRYWLDTEFIDSTLDLISIGIVAEDGRWYYAINKSCDLSKANKWVKENVISKLPSSFVNPQTAAPSRVEGMQLWKSKSTITKEVAEFLGCEVSASQKATKYKVVGDKPEFWAYYADYDWVIFCQLFGAMMDLPEGFPMYCNDIKQECDRLGNPALPKQDDEHNALADARWNKKAWEFLKTLPTINSSVRKITA